MRRVRIRHVDAFTQVPLEGNPAAVVDGEGIDDATMQRVALNQHLSETVFLLPPESAANHARARIFTPLIELPFAGHPIVAAAHILASERLVNRLPDEPLRIETGAGVIPVEVGGTEPRRYTMTQAAPKFRPCEFPLDQVASWIGLAAGDVVLAEYVNTGIRWLIAQVASFEAFQRIAPGAMAASQSDLSMFCISTATPDVHVRVRTFAPGGGIAEDPVTGSSNGCIGALIAKHGLLPARDGVIEYVAEQGIEMGQPGQIFIRASGAGSDALSVQVGGHAVTVLEGELLLPE